MSQEQSPKPSKLSLNEDQIRKVATSGEPATSYLEGVGDIVITKEIVDEDRCYIRIAPKRQTWNFISTVDIREINKDEQSATLGRTTDEKYFRRGLSSALKHIAVEYMRENNLRFMKEEVRLFNFPSFFSALHFYNRKSGKPYKVTITPTDLAHIREMVTNNKIDWNSIINVTTDIEETVDENQELEALILQLKDLFEKTKIGR